MKDLQWTAFDIGRYSCYVGKIRIEKTITDRGIFYTLGDYYSSLFKFESEHQLMRYLTA